MNFSAIVKMSLVSLKANKVRSFLTVLGIIIGISSVIIIISVGAGAQSLILNQIEKTGSNLVGILPGAADDEGPPASVFGIQVTTLKYEDAKEILRRVPEVTKIASFIQGVETISWQNQKKDSFFMGTTANYPGVEDTEVAQGRFFDELEERSTGRVVVLGSKIAQELFGETDPLNQTVKIKRENFKVVGVMKERGKVAFQDPDNQVFIPLTSAQNLLLGIHHVSLIRAKIDKQENMAYAIEQIKQILRDRHNISGPDEDDFSVRSQTEAIESLTTITDALKFFLAAMAGISLIVGGIGIMNIMYVAVTERTREIGLRKAMGATRGNILKQFLVEAVVVTFLGGVAGIIIGFIFSFLVAAVANYLGYSWKFIVSPFSIILGFSVSAAIGIIFGYFPAREAAKQNPIDALRYE
jgi:putative ABC transport system permease protein